MITDDTNIANYDASTVDYNIITNYVQTCSSIICNCVEPSQISRYVTRVISFTGLPGILCAT